MTSHVLKGSGTVPEATALNLRGIQTDAFGEVKGGHKAILDTLQSGETGVLVNGDTVKNLVSGADDFVCTSSGFSVAMENAKGIEFSNSGGGVEYVQMPEVFDLNTLGAEPSLVISTWVTNKTGVSSSVPAIMGYAYQTGTYCQWSIAQENDGGGNSIIAVRINGFKYTFLAPVDSLSLITIVILKSSEGSWIGYAYHNATLIGSTPSTAYPFRDPSLGASPSRNIGHIGGYSGAWDGIVHRLQLFKVDPDTFDAEQWIADEIANNAGRF